MSEKTALRWETAEEKIIKIAKREKALRRRRKISQEELSRISGVSLGSIKRFETSGHISLVSLARISMALSVDEKLSALFFDAAYSDIGEVLREEGRIAEYR